MNFQMIKNGSVTVNAVNFNKRRAAEIVINGKFAHTFEPDSRISKHLDIMTEQDLAIRLSGGHYFLVDGQLIDFRDGQYDGFVHTDQMIGKMFDVLGVAPIDRKMRIKRNTISRKIILGKKWFDHGIAVPGYNQGGVFSSELVFMWNPFVKFVSSIFLLTREICSNGMVGLAPFLNRKIPLINRWEEHLHIANKQIQNKIESVVAQRFAEMGKERASVQELIQIHTHARRRREEALEHGRGAETDRLDKIISVCDPSRLLNVYRPIVLEDTRLGAQVPSDLTTYDMYNLATEICSHSTETDKSTNFALDRISNKLLFDRNDLIGAAVTNNRPALSPFSSPEQAFFGIH